MLLSFILSNKLFFLRFLVLTQKNQKVKKETIYSTFISGIMSLQLFRWMPSHFFRLPWLSFCSIVFAAVNPWCFLWSCRLYHAFSNYKQPAINKADQVIRCASPDECAERSCRPWFFLWFFILHQGKRKNICKLKTNHSFILFLSSEEPDQIATKSSIKNGWYFDIPNVGDAHALIRLL